MKLIDNDNMFDYANFALRNPLGFSKNSDTTTILGQFNNSECRFLSYNKGAIKSAIVNNDLNKLVQYSNAFYKLSGRYKRILDANASLYRYDYFVTPVSKSSLKSKKKQLATDFKSVLMFIENQVDPKNRLISFGKKVLKNGVYYGYKMFSESGNFDIQELPPKYTKSSFKIDGKPLLMFDLSFFDNEFAGYPEDMRKMIISTFPKEIQKGYIKKKQGKINAYLFADSFGYWIPLDPNKTIKFCLDEDLYPALIQVLLPIIGLEEALTLVKKRYSNSLKGILVSKYPIGKEDKLIVSKTDMLALNDRMGMEIQKRTDDIIPISTLADTELLKNDTTSSTNEGKELIESATNEVYDEAGMSQMQFNSDNSTALKYSIENDEANLGILLQQFQNFLNEVVSDYVESQNGFLPNVFYKVEILRTTCHNFIEISKAYKEQVQLGFSKVLPQVALGQSQLSVLETLEFENEVLDLVSKLIPPQMSSTMSKNQLETKKPGTPEKANPAEKTLKNKEAKANN